MQIQGLQHLYTQMDNSLGRDLSSFMFLYEGKTLFYLI